MTIAYLLLVHNQPEQLALLVQSLSKSNSSFFIHVDKGSGIEAFKKAIDFPIDITANIHFVENRISCDWGRYSIVEASLILLRTAMASAQQFDYFILLSGQDYPIKSADYIHQFLAENKKRDFIEYFALPSEKLREKQGGLYRINRFHTYNQNNHSEFPPYSKKLLFHSTFNFFAHLYHKHIRKMPLGMQPYAGSQWWMLSQSTAKRFLKLLDEHKCIEAFFRNVWIPDEIFFQTVLMHLNKEGTEIINDNLRFTAWDKQDDLQYIRSPRVLTLNDFNLMANTDALFARKFDAAQSGALMKKINEKLLNSNHQKDKY